MAKFEPYQTLYLRTSSADYPIVIGKGLLSDAALFAQYLSSPQVMIVSNETIAPLYLEPLQKIFHDRQCDTLLLKDGETYKNEHSLFQIYAALHEKKHHRDTTLIALGGGVVGDITAFAASTYLRGVDCIQIPTSLLAQVDASIGGKTAINFCTAKNIIGSFSQAKAIFIDLNTLQTLPKREFCAGLAEIIKYSLLVGGDFQTLVHQSLSRGLTAQAKDLPEIIRRSCLIKAAIVEEDEHEQGRRALLNLGHTFGHALESCTNYLRWLHGEAVAIGLYLAALLSEAYYGLSTDLSSLVDDLLHLADLPRRIPRDIDLGRLRDAMDSDKKIKNKALRFVLCKKIGACYLEDTISEDLVWTVLQKAVA